MIATGTEAGASTMAGTSVTGGVAMATGVGSGVTAGGVSGGSNFGGSHVFGSRLSRGDGFGTLTSGPGNCPVAGVSRGRRNLARRFCKAVLVGDIRSHTGRGRRLRVSQACTGLRFSRAGSDGPGSDGAGFARAFGAGVGLALPGSHRRAPLAGDVVAGVAGTGGRGTTVLVGRRCRTVDLLVDRPGPDCPAADPRPPPCRRTETGRGTAVAETGLGTIFVRGFTRRAAARWRGLRSPLALGRSRRVDIG